MVKKIATCAIILLGSLSVAGSASAYGGGGPVLPPGFWHHKPELVCTYRVIHLPNGRTINVPKCEIKKDKEFKERLKDFLERVKQGGR